MSASEALGMTDSERDIRLDDPDVFCFFARHLVRWSEGDWVPLGDTRRFMCRSCQDALSQAVHRARRKAYRLRTRDSAGRPEER